MNGLERLMWVAHNMPDECALALERFTRANPRWRGANWEDCLDMLLDSDSHLELTEPMYETYEGAFTALDIDDNGALALVCPIAVTLLYACGEPPRVLDVLAVLEHALGTTSLEPTPWNAS